MWLFNVLPPSLEHKIQGAGSFVSLLTVVFLAPGTKSATSVRKEDGFTKYILSHLALKNQQSLSKIQIITHFFLQNIEGTRNVQIFFLVLEQWPEITQKNISTETLQCWI